VAELAQKIPAAIGPPIAQRLTLISIGQLHV
jgi:hypothetical protein